ncbi:MAG TPA: flavodoxin domain-containing protein, partial [Bacteroidales bacterium]|nr:flavodoxin domain-containing protein [Bacteroidales bacterium]
AFRYYFDVIMKPFSKFMLQAIERIRPLDIEVICTGHGAVLRNDWKKYVALSERYAREALAFPVAGRVLVAYVSAYQNTELMAKKIAEGIRLTGNLEVDLCDLEKVTLPELEQKIIEAAGILAGCPTFSQNILLPVYQLFALINPVRDRNKPAASFGSYGWSGEGVKIMDTVMTALKLNVVEEGLAVKFTPHEAVQQQCIEFGRRFGEKMAMEKS